MKVKVHPHIPLIKAGDQSCVSITPVKRGGRAYYMGTVMLKDVSFVVHDSGVQKSPETGQKNVHAWAVGELISEQSEQYPIGPYAAKHMAKATYDLDKGKFYCQGKDITDRKFNAVMFIGKTMYVSVHSRR